MSFETRVEGITQISITASSDPSQDELTQFLVDGIKDVTNKVVAMKPGEAFKFGTEVTSDDGNGVTITGEVLSVFRRNGNADDLRPAMPIPTALKTLATQKDSLHYRSVYNPVFYMENQKVYILPEPDSVNQGHISYVGYSTVGYGDSSINNFPDEYEQLVVLYASALSCMAAASNVRENMPTKVSKLNEPSFNVGDVELPETPQYIGPVLDFNLSNVNIKLLEEDVEMAEQEMEKLTKNLDKFAKEGEEANKDLTTAMEVFKADIDRLTKNSDRETQLLATEYRSLLYKHQQEVQQYTAEVQESMAKYKWFMEQYMAFMQQYNSQLVGGAQPPAQEEEPKRRGK